ncbi:alpha-E domain-containing protein [Marinospirillum sp.]|uniref:alpha-E domain-containing protein n=1 Tax=Marinospirillum sp. TaxID=2183934 RepID=UPI00385130FD
MLSRVAENIYWLARYLERAEDMARLISVNSHLLLDFPHATKLGWDSLINITSTEELFEKHYTRPDETSVLQFLCGDRRYGSSIIASLANARENLRTTREILPREIWEEVNQLYLNIAAKVESGVTPRNRDSFLKQVIRSCQTVTGLIEGTLSHTQTRTFLTLGRSLERADMTTRIIDVRSANLLPKTAEDLKPFENLQWMSVLKSLTGFQMYRQQVRLRVRGPDVLRFLIQDTAFPRAVACSLKDLSLALLPLPRSEEVQGLVDDLARLLIAADVEELAHEPEQLHLFMDELQVGLNQVHTALVSNYYDVKHPPKP